MRKQNNQRVRKNRLMKKTICAAMSAALLMGWTMAANSEEFFEDEIGEEAYASSPAEDEQWEDIEAVGEGAFFGTDEMMEDEDVILDDLTEEDFLDDAAFSDDEESIDDISDFGVVNDDEIPEDSEDAAEGEEEPWQEDAASVNDEEASEDDAVLPKEAAEILSGECGAQEGTVFWELDEDGVLHIFGEGSMIDWASPEEVPWYTVASQVKTLDIAEGISDIGSYAFSACALKSVRIG